VLEGCDVFVKLLIGLGKMFVFVVLIVECFDFWD